MNLYFLLYAACTLMSYTQCSHQRRTGDRQSKNAYIVNLEQINRALVQQKEATLTENGKLANENQRLRAESVQSAHTIHQLLENNKLLRSQNIQLSACLAMAQSKMAQQQMAIQQIQLLDESPGLLWLIQEGQKSVSMAHTNRAQNQFAANTGLVSPQIAAPSVQTRLPHEGQKQQQVSPVETYYPQNQFFAQSTGSK